MRQRILNFLQKWLKKMLYSMKCLYSAQNFLGKMVLLKATDVEESVGSVFAGHVEREREGEFAIGIGRRNLDALAG